MGCQGWSREGEWGVSVYGDRGSVQEDEKVLEMGGGAGGTAV